MTADVYAGDEDLSQGREQPPRSVATIKLRADGDADVLFRIAAQLNLLNCPPLRFLMHPGVDGEVNMEAVIGNCTEFAVDMVCRKLGRLTSVLEVECRWGHAGQVKPITLAGLTN